MLRFVWNKKDVQYNKRHVFFEQGYQSNTMVKRKVPLKGRTTKKILFPDTSQLRVHLSTGPVMYHEDLKERSDQRKNPHPCDTANRERDDTYDGEHCRCIASQQRDEVETHSRKMKGFQARARNLTQNPLVITTGETLV